MIAPSGISSVPLWRKPPTGHATLCNVLGVGVLKRCAVSESDDPRKHELQCLRLAAECMQLVGDVRSPTLQRHFLGMARAWTAEAENGPANPHAGVATAAPSAPGRGRRSP